MAKFPARLLRSREPSQPALSYEHIENFTKDLEVRRDLGNRASPVNRAHMKRPLTAGTCVFEISQPKQTDIISLAHFCLNRITLK